MDIGALIFPTDKTIRPDRLGTAKSVGTTRCGLRNIPTFHWRAKRHIQPEASCLISISERWTVRCAFGGCNSDIDTQTWYRNLSGKSAPRNQPRKAVRQLILSQTAVFSSRVGVGWNEDEMEHHGVDFKAALDCSRANPRSQGTGLKGG